MIVLKTTKFLPEIGRTLLVHENLRIFILVLYCLVSNLCTKVSESVFKTSSVSVKVLDRYNFID